jgi:hypothetical protein
MCSDMPFFWSKEFHFVGRMQLRKWHRGDGELTKAKGRQMCKINRPVFIALLLLPLAACAPAKQPFLSVQFCLQNKAGTAQLISELRELAHSRNMEFFDSSASTAKDLADSGYRGRERTDGSPAINIGLMGHDGLFVGGGNLGLPGYQVQLGFTTGSDDAESRRFADDVVAQLKRTWQIKVLPEGAAATPMVDCR